MNATSKIDIIKAVPYEMIEEHITYTHHVLISTGIDMMKAVNITSVDVLRWISNIRLIAGSRRLPTHLQEYFLELIVQCAQKDDLVINQEDSCVLQQALDQFSAPDDRNHMKYYPAKICAVLKSCSVSQMTIETTFFEIMENIVITEVSQIAVLRFIVNKLSQRISAMSMMDGIELLIRRHQEVQHVSAGTFYLFKIYTLYELAIENDNEDYGDVIKSVMDGIYLVAKDFDEIDLSSIQLMLWRTGDYFNGKKDFTKAIPWYFHTSSIMAMTAEGQQNTLILARKLALCYAKGNDYVAACTCLENAMGIINKESHARDYLWLVQWSIQNDDNPTKTASLVDKLVLAQGFKPTMFTDVLDSFYTHGKRCQLIVHILKHIVLQNTKERIKDSDQETLLQSKTLFIKQLIFALRCIIYVKTTVYEEILKEESSRIKYLDFRSISNYIRRVCQIIGRNRDYLRTCSQDKVFMNHIEWMRGTAWNLGLYCLSAGKTTEGTRLFCVLNKLSSIFENMDQYTQEQRLIHVFMTLCSKSLGLQKCIRDDVQTLKKHYDQLPECIKALVGLFEIEFHVCQGQFDAAIETFNVYLNLESHSFVVLERMICIVIQSDQCPHKVAFQLLKSFQRLSKLAQQTIDVYARWTRIIISTALAYDQSEAFDCLEWMMNQRLYQKHNYPQNELYYLIVVTWNEGITCYFGNYKLKGEAWCKCSFNLLNYYRQENKARLKEQMDKAYRMFSTQKETKTDA
ncbi:hypothetical protein RMATCC62417_06595 [Rhizopus microsporus]|nr:hypothetical protein RMATCC62417_06595 [Rhizopus microsporus]